MSEILKDGDMSQHLPKVSSGVFVQYKDYTTSSNSQPVTTSAVNTSGYALGSQFQAEMVLEFDNVPIEQIQAFLKGFEAEEEK